VQLLAARASGSISIGSAPTRRSARSWSPASASPFTSGVARALTGEIDWRAVPPLSERPDWWRIAAGVGLAVR